MGEERLVPKLRFSGFTKVWESTRIGEIAEVVGGGTPKTEVGEYWNGEIKWFTPSEIGKTKYIFDSERHISDNGLKNSSAKLLPKYTILLSSRATVGEISIALTECSTNQGFQSLITKNNVDNEFIYYLISTIKNEFLRRSSGSTFLEISKNEIKRIPVTIPELSEQNKISNLFSAIDNKIEMLEKKCQYYQVFKKYLMQRIFSSQDDKLRFNKNTSWEKYTLNDIGKTYNGLSGLSKDNFEKGNSKYITYKSIFDNNILESNFTENVDLNDKSQNEVKKGDLFFTGSSETPEDVGMASVLNSTIKNCYLNSFCFGFRLNNNYIVSPLFLAYYLRSPIMRNKIMILAQGSTRFNLSKKEILKLEIEIPPIAEQQQVIELLQNIDNKINKISMQTYNFHEFKKGLLQQMFV